MTAACDTEKSTIDVENMELIEQIPFASAAKLLEALYIRADASLGAADDLERIKSILLK